MGCNIEFNKSGTRVEFKFSPQKQQLMLDVLCTYGRIKIEKIAHILDIEITLLRNVLRGINFLESEKEDELVQLFLIWIWE